MAEKDLTKAQQAIQALRTKDGKEVKLTSDPKGGSSIPFRKYNFNRKGDLIVWNKI